MKIGILTFPHSPSFGASLQMYALYTSLNNNGAEAEIINYINLYMKDKKHISSHTTYIKNVVQKIIGIPDKRKFRNFEKRMSFFPKQIITDRDELPGIQSRFDRIICGSDQVWNPEITGEDLSFFLDFVSDDRKRASYAPSFGKNPQEQFQNKAMRQIERFSYLSVRETEGAELIENCTNKKPIVVLDPTFLLSKEEWKKEEKKKNGLPKHYIIRFTFNKSEKVDEFVEKLSEKTGMPVYTLGGGLIGKIRDRKSTGVIGPAEWLYIIDHADYVITDSFHGAVFSIIFERKVYVSMASNTNSRLKTLLETCGLNNRMIEANSIEELLESEIEYQDIREKIAHKKKISTDFLKEIICDRDE